MCIDELKKKEEVKFVWRALLNAELQCGDFDRVNETTVLASMCFFEKRSYLMKFPLARCARAFLESLRALELMLSRAISHSSIC
jgi:hypothetical protein